MYVYMSINMYVYIHIQVYVYMCTYVHIHYTTGPHLNLNYLFFLVFSSLMMVENYQKYMQQIQNVYIFGGRKKKTIHFLSTLSEVHSDLRHFTNVLYLGVSIYFALLNKVQ